MMHFFYHFPICSLCIFMNLTLVNNKFGARRNSKQSSYKVLQMRLPSFWYKSSQTSSAQWGSILCSSWHTRESLMTRPVRTKLHLSFRKRISNFFLLHTSYVGQNCSPMVASLIQCFPNQTWSGHWGPSCPAQMVSLTWNHNLVGDTPDFILYTANLENVAPLERKCKEDIRYHNTTGAVY